MADGMEPYHYEQMEQMGYSDNQKGVSEEEKINIA